MPPLPGRRCRGGGWNRSPGAKAAIRNRAVTLTLTSRLTDAAGKTATASRNVKVARYVVKVPVTG